MFSWRNKKIVMWIPLLSGAMIALDKQSSRRNVFLIPPPKDMLWVLIRSTVRRPYKYPQHTLLWRNKKNNNTFWLVKVVYLELCDIQMSFITQKPQTDDQNEPYPEKECIMAYTNNKGQISLCICSPIRVQIRVVS